MIEDFHVRRRGELLEALVDDEILALHVESGTCFGFNPTASRVWALLESPRQMSEISAALEAEFDVAPEVCQRELLELLRELESDGLIGLERVSTRR